MEFHDMATSSWLAESQTSQQAILSHPGLFLPSGKDWMTPRCSAVSQSLRQYLEVSPLSCLFGSPTHSIFRRHSREVVRCACGGDGRGLSGPEV